MFGLGVIVPCWMRSRIRPETVGWASPKLVVGLGQAVALGRCRRVAADQLLDHPLADLERHARVVAHLVDRFAEEVLREDPRAAARRPGRCARRRTRTRRRCPSPSCPCPRMTERRLPAKSVVVDVGVGVQLLAREACRRRGTPARASAASSGGRWRRAARRTRVDRPSSRVSSQVAVRRRRAACSTLRLEADPLAEAEVVDVVVEVRRDLRVVREVRIGLAASGSPSTPSARARC